MRKHHLGVPLAAAASVLAATLAPVLATSQASAATASTNVVVATGTVRAATGVMAGGATVDLYAWPSDKILISLKPGQEVPRKLIGTTTATSSGSFSLSVPAASLAAAAASSGFANLEVDSGTSTWFLTQSATDWKPATIHLTGAADATGPAVCEVKYKGQLKRRFGTILQEYDWGNAPGVTQSVTYSSGQSTSLSVGISPSGKAGTYTGGGTETESTTSNQSFPAKAKPGFYHFRTPWRIAKYIKVCGGGRHQPGIPASFKHIVRSNGWVPGDAITKVSKAPKATICATELKGGAFSTSNEKAATISAGLTIPEVNFSVSMQTGYDRSAQITLSFHQKRTLCGTGGRTADKAGVVVIKK